MTNEEKASELGKKYEIPCHGVGDCEFEARQAALEAMVWKDLHFAAEKQALIDNACEWLENIIFDKVDALFYDDNDIEFVKTVSGKEFAELFRKAMEETK